MDTVQLQKIYYMRRRRIMLDRSYKKDPYTLVMLTLDAHSIGSVERIKSRFSKIYPELEIIVHAAASWEEDPSSLLKTKEDLAKANMVLITLVFLEDHISAILPDLKKAREKCDPVSYTHLTLPTRAVV